MQIDDPATTELRKQIIASKPFLKAIYDEWYRTLADELPPIDGKAAIRAFVTASLKIPGFKIHWVSDKPVFSADGKMAYLMSSVETTAPGANGALETTHGRSVTVWQPGADGVWRCVVDISNDAPAS